MNAETARAVDQIARCAFCKATFTKVIKLIPECGNSVCGRCHQDILQDVNELSEYICRECNRWHKLVAGELDDNHELLKMAELQGQSNAERLSALFKDIEAKIDRLKTFDVEEEVTAYCDKLAKEVMETIDAAFSHLNKVGNKLFERINDYRSSLLDKRRSNAGESAASSPKRLKTSISSFKQDISNISIDIKNFEPTAIAQNEFLLSDSETLISLQRSLNEYRIKVDAIEDQVKTDAFNGQFMVFKPNERYVETLDQMGDLVLDGDMNDHASAKDETIETISTSSGSLVKQRSRTSSRDQKSSSSRSTSIVEMPNPQTHVYRTMISHRDRVRQVAFLFDGHLASCSDDTVIEVWNLDTGCIAFELTGSPGPVRAIAPLSKSWLASSTGRDIYIWSLKDRKLTKTLTGHEDSIFSLARLSNFNLASASVDDTIKIWDPFRGKENLIKTLRGHGVRSRSSLALLDDDLLATCSNDLETDRSMHKLKIWSPEHSRPLDILSVGSDDSCCLVALRDERVAVGFKSGRIRIYDQRGEEETIVWKDCHEGGVLALLESLKGYLISAGSQLDPTVKVWNPSNGRLVNIIHPGHTDNICSLSLSPNGRLLATGSHDKTVRALYFDY